MREGEGGGDATGEGGDTGGDSRHRAERREGKGGGGEGEGRSGRSLGGKRGPGDGCASWKEGEGKVEDSGRERESGASVVRSTTEGDWGPSGVVRSEVSVGGMEAETQLEADSCRGRAVRRLDRRLRMHRTGGERGREGRVNCGRREGTTRCRSGGCCVGMAAKVAVLSRVEWCCERGEQLSLKDVAGVSGTRPMLGERAMIGNPSFC